MVATAIFRAVQQRRNSVYLPALTGVFAAFGMLFPGLMDLYLSQFQPYVVDEGNSVAKAQEKHARGAT